MHFHLPKPLHGWREFLGEVGIIVVGVLIALGAEQVVQSFEWNHRIHASEAAMLQELSDDDGPQAYARYAVHECLQNRLNLIRTAVGQSRSRQQVIALASAYRAPFWTWDSLALAAANSSNVFTQMEPSVAQRWAGAYTVMPALDRANEREFQDQADLAGIASGDGPLSSDERTTIVRAVEHLRQDEFQIFAAVRVLLPQLYELGARFQPQQVRALLARFPNSARCLITPPARSANAPRL